MSDGKLLIGTVAVGALAWFLLHTRQGAALAERLGFTPAPAMHSGDVVNVNLGGDYDPTHYPTMQPGGDATGGVIGSCGTCQEQTYTITFGSAEQQAAAFAPILRALVLPLEYLPPSYPNIAPDVRRVNRYSGMNLQPPAWNNMFRAPWS